MFDTQLPTDNFCNKDVLFLRASRCPYAGPRLPLDSGCLEEDAAARSAARLSARREHPPLRPEAASITTPPRAAHPVSVQNTNQLHMDMNLRIQIYSKMFGRN